uniref:Secreted protein n=1 Tax=Streptomyces sp. NBC_00008 TaxID=2903610 RepID=A0AAU2VR01_9ACTN
MVGEGGEPEACTPEPGSFAVDVRDGRVGRVTGRVGPYVRLRPPGGGPEWDCPPESVRPASPGLVLRARVTEVNREGQLPR